MSVPQIRVCRDGDRGGFIVVTMPRADEYRMGLRLVVGDVYRVSPDGEAEVWRAWLWPEAGGDLAVTQSCEAVDAISPRRLCERLQKRADRDGPWWTAGQPALTSGGTP